MALNNPLVIDRIKNAKGKVRVSAITEGGKYAIQVLEGTVWVSIFTSDDRTICERHVHAATSKIILG